MTGTAGGFRIHPLLLADCHRLGALDGAHLLLQRNAVVPWLILVPEVETVEFLELPADRQARLLAQCAALARFLKGHLACTRVNFGAIGNLVPQCHLHVVGRREGDACWPRPVWGHLHEVRAYTEAELAGMTAALREAVDLRAAPTNPIA